MSNDPKVTALRAVAHPVRLQILSLLTGAEMSAAEVARELGLTHANASYHLRKLEAVGELTVTGEERIRGGVAKRYRHQWRASPVATYKPKGSRRPADASGFVRAAADALVRRYAHRDTRRGAGRSSLTDAELWVTPETYAEVHALLEQASHQLHDAAQPPRTEGTIRVNLTAAAFRMTDG
jgi:DNA-binding transcriptional ArsR family regulator